MENADSTERPAKNRVIAEMFNRMADILEFQGEGPFKVNAYRKAARVIKDLQENIETLGRANQLKSIPGVGTGLAKKIDEFLKTGRMSKYEEIVQSVPSGLTDLLGIQNLGPKTLALAHERLGIQDLNGLKQAIHDGRLANLPGMGQKKADNILKGIELREKGSGRIPLGRALDLVEDVIHRLRKLPSVGRIYPAGSIRRMQETVGDIDILIETEEGETIVKAFTSLPQVTRVLNSGKTKGSVLVEGDIQIDVRAIDRDSYGSALQYFTGSQAHNIRLRGIAKQKGMKISEYGIFRGGEKIGGGTEEEIYEALGMPWIPPELREDRGEVEAALGDGLPELVDLYDINGDLHIHTRWSDGTATIEEMAQKAVTLGYSFIAICDHSRSAAYAGGLTPERLEEQIGKIHALNERMENFRILAGNEVDIRSDGSLDFADELLSRLDIVIAAIHSGFKQNVTQRLIAAAQNPLVTIIAHPTGRLINQREGYDVDLERVMQACSDTGTAMSGVPKKPVFAWPSAPMPIVPKIWHPCGWDWVSPEGAGWKKVM
jgi:DNA polymerase (family 10)